MAYGVIRKDGRFEVQIRLSLRWCVQFSVPRYVTTPDLLGPYVVLFHSRFQGHDDRLLNPKLPVSQISAAMGLNYSSLHPVKLHNTFVHPYAREYTRGTNKTYDKYSRRVQTHINVHFGKNNLLVKTIIKGNKMHKSYNFG